MRIEGGGEAVARPARRGHRALGRHAVDRQIDQALRHGLGLHIAAGRAEGQEAPPVLYGDRRIGREPRPLAGRERRGMRGVGPGLAAARRDGEADAGGHRAAIGAVRGRGREHIALAIDRADIGGVERRRRERPRGRRRAGRGFGPRARIARRRHFRHGAAHVDPGQTPGRIGRGGKRVDRHVHEARVAEPGVAIRHGELHRLDAQMHRVGAVMAERRQVALLQHVQQLHQRRPLAPGPAGVNLPVAEAPGHRLLHADAEPARSSRVIQPPSAACHSAMRRATSPL